MPKWYPDLLMSLVSSLHSSRINPHAGLPRPHSAPTDFRSGTSLPSLCSVAMPGPSLQPPHDVPPMNTFGMLVLLVTYVQVEQA